jgi:small-conductance mechanosensitive channel
MLLTMLVWRRLIVIVVVIVLTVILARLIDRRIARRELSSEAMTRYRVLRRGITATIMVVGILSALLVIPEIRAVAGGLLASSAVLGIIIGFASQRTLGNFVAGILIAFTQPLRLGDEVTIEEKQGVVEEIGLIYTFVRVENGDRLVIPNEKLASDTIRNLTIRSTEKVAEITVQIPLEQDLDRALDALRDETTGDVFVSSLEASTALITMRERAATQSDAERAARELRVRAHRRLRAAGVFA